MPVLVNGEGQSLSSVNQDKSSAASGLKDSVKDSKEFPILVDVLMKSGTDGKIGSNLAPVIGLPKAMPTRDQAVWKGDDMRGCLIVYEETSDSDSKVGGRRPYCAYIVKTMRSGRDNQVRYFRVDLNGKLEKVVVSRSKRDENGKAVRGSGVKFDEDINSPEVRKAFDAEMKFWLKDWLKKERKKAAAAPAAPK